MTDARFEDGAERSLTLRAEDAEDISVISALVQDAVFPASDMTWDRKARRFALLVNRFRWEDRAAADAEHRPYERVRSVLMIGDAGAVRTQGVDRRDADTILSLLSLSWYAGEDGTGTLTLTLAGDGAIELDVEALDITLRDVTRPYRAPSGKVPGHPEG